MPAAVLSRHRDGHAALAGDQADVTDGHLAVPGVQILQVQAHRTAGPASEEVDLPVVSRAECARAAKTDLQMTGALPVGAGPAARAATGSRPARPREG